MRKKLLLVCMVGLFSMLMLVACKKNSQYVGVWKGTHGTYNGIDVTFEQVGLAMDIDIKADGTVSVITDGTTGTGTWEEKEDKLIISSDGESLTGYMENDKIVINEETTGVKMYFEKQVEQ